MGYPTWISTIRGDRSRLDTWIDPTWISTILWITNLDKHDLWEHDFVGIQPGLPRSVEVDPTWTIQRSNLDPVRSGPIRSDRSEAIHDTWNLIPKPATILTDPMRHDILPTILSLARNLTDPIRSRSGTIPGSRYRSRNDLWSRGESI